MTLHLNPSGNKRLSRTSPLILLATTPEHVACFRYIMLHILYLKHSCMCCISQIDYTKRIAIDQGHIKPCSLTSQHSCGCVNKRPDLLCMYCTTLGVRPWRDSVISTSAALFLQGTLWTGHQLVIAENNRVRSSFLANSSAGEEWLHNLTNTLKNIRKNGIQQKFTIKDWYRK